MFNDIKIGPVTFHMYGLMIAIGFAAALMMCLKRGKKRGLNEDIIYGIFFCAIFGGMIGCRLLYYIVEIPEILKDRPYSGTLKTDTLFTAGSSAVRWPA